MGISGARPTPGGREPKYWRPMLLMSLWGVDVVLDAIVVVEWRCGVPWFTMGPEGSSRLSRMGKETVRC